MCVVQGRKNAKRKNKCQTSAAEWDHWAGTRAKRCGGSGAPPPCSSVLLHQPQRCSKECRGHQKTSHGGACHFIIWYGTRDIYVYNLSSFNHNYEQNFTPDIFLIASILVFLWGRCCEALFRFVSAEESTQQEAMGIPAAAWRPVFTWLSKWLNPTPESPGEQAKLLVQSDIWGDACLAPTQSSTCIINVN